ncbi:Bug family tripartite tricarboxylate transporter substrate binding protein [Pararhizobium mangrovi]|uniref:Tripartite tricarboxylate transporter substrate binding protein n=1 Tax=Pararhizobium mangrovi TaxID=2590452 RepID=A0A506UH09_9HYPH|nr:tripartite tricarboxylate transporter substrate binding protein [Pararhizobium mangrovi]TPW31877.1 tripartite tricarboxylate transporter substrate binding protein [Pararhizobium mangrovi]
MLTRRRFQFLAMAAAMIGSLSMGAAHAADWPTKPVHIIVPYSPGGNTDLIARSLAKPLSEKLGQPVVVENKPGAGGTIAASQVAKADPDGYTLLLGDIATHGVDPFVYGNLKYDPQKDFQPIAQITSIPLVLAVGPKVKVDTVKGLIQYAKDNPGQLDYASAGIGSAQQLAFEYFKAKAGIDAVHIPFNGSTPARTAIMSGEVGAIIDGTIVPNVKEGDLKALAVTGDKRTPALPDVPTMQEAGVDGYTFTSWHGLFAPAGTDKAIVQKLNKAVDAILGQPEFVKQFQKLNINLVGGSPEDFSQFIAQESDKLGKLVKQAGIKKR